MNDASLAVGASGASGNGASGKVTRQILGVGSKH